MTRNKSQNLYTHPFNKEYWKDAAAELKDTRMLVITALMIALRVALKPLAIPLGPQLSIQTAMLATALGAMIYGPVMAIPAALISDTVGFLIYPTGDYFLPFALTEIASTVIYALCLYRAKPSALRVTIARFAICALVNVVLQQLIFSWQYLYMGQPEKAMNSIMGITGLARIFKNLCFFPVESVVLTLFLQMLMPVVQRSKLVYSSQSNLKFNAKQIVALVCMLCVGVGSSVGYLVYRYSPAGENKTRSGDYTPEQRVEENKAATQLLLQETDTWDEETVICIVDSAYRELFAGDTDYTISVYVLDEEAFQANVSQKENYSMDTLWSYSKSGPAKDTSMVKVAQFTFTKNEQSGQITGFDLKPVEPKA